jgi:hypothetical protein
VGELVDGDRVAFHRPSGGELQATSRQRTRSLRTDDRDGNRIVFETSSAVARVAEHGSGLASISALFWQCKSAGGYVPISVAASMLRS